MILYLADPSDHGQHHDHAKAAAPACASPPRPQSPVPPQRPASNDLLGRLRCCLLSRFAPALPQLHPTVYLVDRPVGERPSLHPAVKAEGSGLRGRVFWQRRSEGAAQNGQWGRGALQCERLTELAGSSARSSPLKTLATAARLRLSSKIKSLGIQGGSLSEDP